MGGWAVLPLPIGSTTTNQIAVTAHTGAAANSHQRNAGWNMLGVPYMSCFTANNGMTGATFINGEIVIDASAQEPFSYQNTTVPYVSVPSHNFDEYLQSALSDTQLRPGWSFFVQVGTGGTLTFVDANRQTDSSTPLYARRRSDTARPLTTGILLSYADGQDKTTFVVSDRYSTLYETGADLEKMFGSANKVALYSLMDDNTPLVFNALSETDVSRPVPIGYRAPKAGQYTFSLNPQYAEAALEHLYLYDAQENIVVDLLKEDYEFFTTAQHNDRRFTLSAVVATTDTPTDIEQNTLSEVRVIGGVKHLTLIGLMPQAHVYVYDMAGKLVITTESSNESTLRLTVPTAGVYNVRIEQGTDSKTYRSIVK